MSIKKNNAFTLVEVLVSISILFIIVIGAMSMQNTFIRSTSNNMMSDFLADAASNEMMKCQTRLTPATATLFNPSGKRNIYVYIQTTGTCTPDPNLCNEITITSSNVSFTETNPALIKKKKTFTLKGKVCNFS